MTNTTRDTRTDQTSDGQCWEWHINRVTCDGSILPAFDAAHPFDRCPVCKGTADNRFGS